MENKNEVGWLIERRKKNDMPEYWQGAQVFSEDHHTAIRFARINDAEWFIHNNPDLFQTGIRAVEHMWEVRPTAQESKE